MTMTPLELAPTDETGAIPVFHLKRFWSRVALARRQRMSVRSAEWNRDRLCLSVLGVGLEETMRYLYNEQPDFAAFEDWVLARAGVLPPADEIERFNQALSGASADATRVDLTSATEAPEAILDATALRFFDEHGYVVLRGALAPAHARACERFVWDAIEADPADRASWYRPHPLRQNIMVQCFRGPLLEANRRNTRIRDAFRQLYGRDDVWPTTDRVGFNPPVQDGARYAPAHLHWDADLTAPVPFELQGLIYLNDVAPNQGAFSCVPGFHRRLADWLRALPPGADPQAENLDALGRVFVPGRAGDMVIWHQALPHGASYNTADYPRLVQYLTYVPLVDR